MANSKRQQGLMVGAFFAILGVAAYFRLADLGMSSLRADTIVFWNVCQQPISGGMIMKDWLNIMGLSGQFPFPMAFTKWFMDIFGLSLSHYTIRLPSALWGIVAVGAAYGAGHRLGGAKLGLLLSALFAVNPFHIQTSREVYYYAPLVLGSTLMLWGLIWTLQDDAVELSQCWGAILVTLLGFVLVTYSQPVGWPLAFVCTLLTAGYRGWRCWKAKTVFKRDMVLAAAYAVAGWPLLTAPWGIKQMQQISTGAARESALAALATSQGSLTKMLHRSLTSFAWGSTDLRLLFTIVVLCAAIYFLVRFAKEQKTYWVPLLVIIPSFALAMVARSRAGAMYESRYVVPLLPVYLMFLAIGLMGLARLVHQLRPTWKGEAGLLVVGVLAVAINVQPAYLCTQVTGRPTPYKKVIEAVNELLPRNTLVLVDRWFEPWNELKVYPSTNAQFTFTVPNEPIATYLQANWRQTAINFFAQYPNAAYLEIAKSYWDVPEVGSWDWPRSYFERQLSITNEAGFALRELGLATRGDFYNSTTGRLVVALFYNTKEDLFYRAQEVRIPTYALFGEGWGYTKTQDYRDWRILEGQAVVELFNATPQPLDVAIRVIGTLAQGSKKVRADSDSFTFGTGQPQEWIISRTLQPGLTELVLRDDLWDLANIPLMTMQVRCDQAPPKEPSHTIEEPPGPTTTPEAP